MGLSDRDYNRFNRPGTTWNLPGGLSVTAWLIVINLMVFVVQMLTTPRGIPGSSMDVLTRYGHFSTFTLLTQLEFWRVLTFQFLHGNILHIFFNMMGLWIFGRIVEEYLGGKKYLAFYLICGVSGALMYLLLNGLAILFASMGWPLIPGFLLNDPRVPLVGASAGVFGVIMACAYITPNTVVQLLFPPVPLKMRTLAYAFVGIAVLMVVFGSQNAGGEAAHLGGAIAGFFFIRRSHLLRDFFDVLGDSRKKGPKAAKGEKAVAGGGGGTGAGGGKSIFRTSIAEREAELDREVDRILAKVKAEGVQSLSESEKSVLRRATQRGGGA